MWSRECLLALAVLLSHLASLGSGSSPQRFTFSLSAECADHRCSSLVAARSRTECAARCGYSDVCTGFSYMLDGSCFHVEENCFLNFSCPDHLPVYSKHISQQPCFNGGSWSVKKHACSCRGGWVGSQCERKPYKCEELYTFGYPTGNHDIDIDVYQNQTLLVNTKCEVGSNYWRTFIFSSDARGNYSRNWTEYSTGFHEDQWNRWLGLQNMYAFNQMGLVTVAFSVVAQYGSIFSEFIYENFQLSDATSGYSFTYSSSHSRSFGSNHLYQLGDVLSFSQRLPFSTFDKDRDNDGENCAVLHGAGWWLDTCTSGQPVNPLGRNPKSAPSVSELQKLWIPGMNISQQSIQDSFQSVFMTFID
ncbi:hypothetical protein BsWGS_17052 [Bradybaena similaris]